MSICTHNIILYSQSSIEFYVVFDMAAPEFHGIPWNSMELGDSPFGGPRIPWNFMSLHVPWNFRSLMEFHGTSHLGMGILWNSMEFLASSMEFHGIPWNCEILINFIIGEVYFIVCCMISCHCISDNPLVVDILRYFNSKAPLWRPSFWFNGDIPF